VFVCLYVCVVFLHIIVHFQSTFRIKVNSPNIYIPPVTG